MAVSRANIQNIFPLTALQQGMLFHSLLEQTAGAYFQQVIWQIRGTIDVVAFEAAWNALVARHEALRTVFGHLGSDKPLQVVLRQQPIKVEVHDFSAIAPAQHQQAVDRCIAADREKPFDLARGPLLRVYLLQFDTQSWTAIWSHHHIVLDGWSVAIVLADWLKFYAAFCRQEAPRLDAPVSPSRYMRWLGGLDQASSERYWRTYIDGFDTATPVPETTGPRTSQQVARLDFSFDLGVDKTRHLARWASAHEATQNAAVHAIWAMLLSRYCATDDVVFGTVVSGRPPDVDDIERMVGNFVNTIPMRIRISADSTAVALLKAAHADLVEGAPHHFHPLARTQALSPLRSNLLGSLIAYENYPTDVSSGDRGAELGFTITGAQTVEFTHYPLAVQFLPGTSLRVRIICRDDRYTHQQLERLEEHFRNLVSAVVADDAVRVADIDFLGDAERRMLTDALNPLADEGVPSSVLPLFERQVSLRPNAVAVEGPGLRLSYLQLDEMSDFLAREMQANHRIERNDVVPLVADRDARTIVAMLGILKSGAAYLPLDPEHPPARLAQFIDRSQAKLVLAQAASVDRVRTAASVPVVAIERMIARSGDGGIPSRPAAVSPRDLAYVIFTSGSTGEAKGVGIEHRSLGNLVAALSEAIYFELPTDLRVGVVASFAVDASIKQVYAALCGGHTLVIADAESRRDPVALADWLLERNISVIDLTPTMLSAIVATGNLEKLCRQPRHLLLGGEPLPASLVSTVLGVGAGLEITNVYGPTECCVDTTAHRCSVGEGRVTPIGRPLKNQRVYVLDDQLRLVPFGAPGEICIGGRGVARGYLGRPDLTAEKFKADPFAPGATLYRTGDRGRWRIDGTLEFLGRYDDQVKVRGHRVELAEIEARLREHPGIAAAAILTRQEQQDSVLVACVVPREPLTVHGLRRYLSALLPEHMLPSTWFIVAALPLTPGGKVDRRALASGLEIYQRVPTGVAHVPPRSALEQRLVALWAELLSVEEVGVEDNYFALGGDSIKAITLVSRLHREGLGLVLKDLYAHPTIAELAPCLRRQDTDRRKKVVERGASLPVAPMQARRLEGLSEAPRRYNQTIILRASGALDAQAMRTALEFVVNHHEALRLAFRKDGGAWRQNGVSGGSVRLDVVNLENVTDAARELARHADGLQAAHDPAEGRLIASAIYRQCDGDRLLLSIHHFGIDAVSWNILLEDLQHAYQAIRAGGTPDLKPSTSYLDWVAVLDGEAKAHSRDGERGYWSNVMSAAVQQIPVHDARAPNLSADVAEVSFHVEAAISTALTSGANAAYRTTPEDLLIVALMRALYRESGLLRLRIAVEGNGRANDVGGLDISRSVGWFTVIHPVVIDLPVQRDIGYQIRAIKEQLRAVPDNGVGYGRLRWMSAKEPATDLAGDLPILFNYLGRIGEAASRHGFAWDDALIGSDIDGALKRLHELETSAMLIGSELRLVVRHSARRVASSKARALVEAWGREISAVVDFLVRDATPRLTPSDLTYAGISLDDLESIAS